VASSFQFQVSNYIQSTFRCLYFLISRVSSNFQYLRGKRSLNYHITLFHYLTILLKNFTLLLLEFLSLKACLWFIGLRSLSMVSHTSFLIQFYCFELPTSSIDSAWFWHSFYYSPLVPGRLMADPLNFVLNHFYPLACRFH
jgi:hypothetical protein